MELVNVEATALACDCTRGFGGSLDVAARHLTGTAINLRDTSHFGAQSFNVTLDGTTISTFSGLSTSYTAFTTAAFAATAGTHTLAFTGTNTTGDNTDFIDRVFVVPSVALGALARW